MKHKYFLLIVLFTLILPAKGYAQDKVTNIDLLVIELWPDYDRASVLVLITGTLPTDTKLPASVTLPFPETAQLNAVARIDSTDGIMKDDISSSLSHGELTFITPDLRFRVEYYLLYTVNNNQRTFNFNWVADLSVNKLQLRVQQPISASSLSTEPAPVNVFGGEDGFTYHAFPEQAVPAGKSISVQVDYTMIMAKLSAESLTPSSESVQEPKLPSTSKTTAGVNWSFVAVVLICIIIVIVFVLKITTGRAGPDRPITSHEKSKTQSRAKFCSNCGSPKDKDDKFCRKCGTGL